MYCTSDHDKFTFGVGGTQLALIEVWGPWCQDMLVMRRNGFVVVSYSLLNLNVLYVLHLTVKNLLLTVKHAVKNQSKVVI